MTEVPKGLMTSKELGMAVADRLRQAEKRSEATPKQQALMRRALQPPATREQRADRHAENQTKAQLRTLEEQPQPRQKDLSPAPAPVNPDNHNAAEEFGVDPAELREVPFYVLLDRVLSQGHDPHSFLRSLGIKPYSFFLTQDHSRQRTPGTREFYDVDRARLGFPPMTDEQWKWNILGEAARDNRTREFIDKECAKDGLPPLTDEEWKEVERIKRIETMPEKRTFWKVIGEMIVGLVEGGAQSFKDKATNKK